MTQTETFTQTIPETHQSTNTPIFAELLHDTNHLPIPCADPVPASTFNFTNPFAICQQPLTNAIPQPVQWLWQQRLPLAGITLLDGDRRLGKTLLAHQIAAAVSSGSPMPDGTPTIQGGVIIITPHTDPSTTQLQQLTDLGADLSHIQILSSIHDPTSPTHPSGYRPFSLPEDLPRLFDAIDQLDARLIILDSFVDILSKQRRCTTRHLNHLLTDLNQRLIERRVACLLIRNCHARGGSTKPSILERSDHFPIIAISHLLLAPDPIEPDRLLLSHALSRHAALTPTLTLHIQPLPTNPNLPHIAVHGTHHLTATHLLTQRPDTLHRQLLSKHLYTIISHATEPISAPTLCAQSPHSSPSQVQHALKDLLQTGQIHRPTRGFYTLNHTTTPELNVPAATMVIPTKTPKLDATAAITPTPIIATTLDTSAATTSTPAKAPKLDAPAATTFTPTRTTELDVPAATAFLPTETSKLNITAATTLNPTTTPELNITATTNANPIIATTLDASATTTVNPTITPKLATPAATTPTTTTPTTLDASAAITPNPTDSLKLNIIAATTPHPTSATTLDASAATTTTSTIPTKIDTVAAITPTPSKTIKLESTAATTPNPTAATNLNTTAAITLSSKTPHHQHSHNHQHKQKKWRGRPGQSKKR